MLRKFVLIPFIKIQELRLKRKLSNKDAKVELRNPFIKVSIVKEKNATFIVNGTLKFYDFTAGGNNLIQIYLARDSTFRIDGDFIIGRGVKITVEKGGLLYIGGDKDALESGISCDSRIMVSKKVIIGKDFGCAWNVFITDCDWHYIEYDGKPNPMQSDVIIGDHVWICPDCSILKGTVIKDDSIIGTKSLLSGKTYPANSLIAGIPAKVVESKVKWTRDLSKRI